MTATDIRRHCAAKRLGASIEIHAAIGSTNTAAMERGRAGAPEGTVVLAESQTQGRGRMGRRWASPPGLNLYASIVLRPRLPAAEVPLITLVAGLATAESVAELVSEGVGIKWPNDVVIDGRKAAGILSEMDAGDAARFVVVGIGVNLNAGAGDFPPELRAIATSVRQASGAEVDRARFCGRLLSHLEHRYDTLQAAGFAALLPAWQRWDVLRDRPVEVRQGDQVIAGTGRGIGADGRLRVETAGGVVEVVAGDVTIVGGYGAGC
jgi:BirA family biotin operon repressor/biotin-[acetyl-CoA-carboxylase] ligase